MKFKKNQKVKYGELIGIIDNIQNKFIEASFEVNGKKVCCLFDRHGQIIPLKDYINNSKLEII